MLAFFTAIFTVSSPLFIIILSTCIHLNLMNDKLVQRVGLWSWWKSILTFLGYILLFLVLEYLSFTLSGISINHTY